MFGIHQGEKMRIGELNKRIEIQIPSKVSDGMGGWISTFTTWKTVDAAIWDATSNERNQASSTNLVITHRIRIRYKQGLKASYRIKFGLRYFNITSLVNPNEANRWLDIYAKEVA
jgi:SPP1 family predicted phage head-tail adaptor